MSGGGAPHLYVLYAPSPFLKRAHDEGLVLVSHTDSLPAHAVLFERHDTACACPDRLVVRGRTLVTRASTVVGHPCYALPDGCTPDEELTVVAWLTRDRFLSFQLTLEKENINDKFKKLKRYLVPNNVFLRKRHSTCPVCDELRLIREPVFCLKSIVVSAENKGPTVESVLNGQ